MISAFDLLNIVESKLRAAFHFIECAQVGGYFPDRDNPHRQSTHARIICFRVENGNRIVRRAVGNVAILEMQLSVFGMGRSLRHGAVVFPASVASQSRRQRKHATYLTGKLRIEPFARECASSGRDTDCCSLRLFALDADPFEPLPDTGFRGRHVRSQQCKTVRYGCAGHRILYGAIAAAGSVSVVRAERYDLFPREVV